MSFPRLVASLEELDPRIVADRALQPTPDYFEAALQACCAALMALQLAEAFSDGDVGHSAQLNRAITAVRAAIADVRAVQGVTPSRLPEGFVIGCQASSWRGQTHECDRAMERPRGG